MITYFITLFECMTLLIAKSLKYNAGGYTSYGGNITKNEPAYQGRPVFVCKI